MKVDGASIAWVKGVTDTGAFPMSEEEWNALFKDSTEWHTISVIRLAATMLNCLIFTYTPVLPVPQKEKLASNATWVWKDVNPVPLYAT